MKGTVFNFRNEKGFGSIVSPEHDGRIFVHFRDIAGVGYRSLEQGQKVEFDLVPDERKPGQMKAANVRRVLDLSPLREAVR